MTAFVTDLIPADPAPAPRARPRVVLIGTALVIAAIAAVFVGLFAIYFAERSATIASGAEWIPGGAGTLPLTPTSVMLVTLGMSSITVQWVVWGLARGDRLNSYLAAGLTLVLAVAFLNQGSYVYTFMGWEIAGDLAVQAVLIYAITGLQIAMLVSAMIFLGLMAFRSMAGGYSARDHEGVVAAALYWHAAVAAYAVIWMAIYQVK